MQGDRSPVTETRGMVLLAVLVAVIALEHAGWRWPADALDRWLNGGAR
jgi:hypothetical protein